MNNKKENYAELLAKVNALLNRRLCQANAFDNASILVRHLACPDGEIRLQPTYCETFFGMASFVKLADDMCFSWYVTTEKNLGGHYAPVLVIFSND